MVKVCDLSSEVWSVDPLRVTEPVWGPVAKLPVAALNVTAPLPVPEAGLTVNQAVLSLAVQVKVPPRSEERRVGKECGFGPPWVAEKESGVGPAAMVG